MTRIFPRMALAILLALPLALSAEPRTLVFSHVVSPDTPKGKMAEMFKKIVERKMGDRFRIEIHPNGTLMDDNEAVSAIADGRIQFAAPSVSKFDAYTQKLKVFDLPFLFPNMDAVEQFQQSATGQSLLTSMTQEGIVGLGYLHNGLKQLSANKPFREPGDLAGLRFRIMNSDVLKKQFETINAIPVPMAFSDVYQALADDRIQGQENTWSNIYSKRFYEYQPYIMESNHGVLDYMVITNATFWQSLTDDERRHFSYAMSNALGYGNAVAKAKSMNDREALKNARGVTLVKPTPQELSDWQAAMKPLWQEYASAVGEKTLQAAEQAAARTN
ncbi:DctP family TRAP transporter solute-binding subunit [Marinobacter halodurans]|uniref:DctP family TRAP transporter solute-binding subunit n=1 Tax=Marinobacter halodurans TaxID=2528979 RepID=A0ABY1ZJG9_9GAMM|nr:DctP family TRAP transporter solute-binding subunit [Marinobacter halodurans]TBW51892.1 DctP family TRAP transporter solute-binding subunit [Marinobacter halodurans]